MQHGYEIVATDATAYDVAGDSTAWGQSNVIAHLRSGFRFYDKWAHRGLKPEYAVPFYKFDPATNHWRGTPLPAHGWTSAYQDGYVDMARAWLADNGYYVKDGATTGSTKG